jgi:hypothetical protein
MLPKGLWQSIRGHHVVTTLTRGGLCLTPSWKMSLNFNGLVGAAREIRTPDPIITNDVRKLHSDGAIAHFFSR